MELARRHAQPADHQCRRERRPRHVLAARRHQRVECVVELQRVPQRETDEHVAELTGALEPDLPHRTFSIGPSSDSGGSNRLGCMRRPVIRSAKDLARRRAAASSLPSRATTSCRTRRPVRTDRTSNQYSWALPFFRTVVRRTYTCTASHASVAASRAPINQVGCHSIAFGTRLDEVRRARGLKRREESRERVEDCGSEVVLDGPHVALATTPREAAAAIAAFVRGLNRAPADRSTARP